MGYYLCPSVQHSETLIVNVSGRLLMVQREANGGNLQPQLVSESFDVLFSVISYSPIDLFSKEGMTKDQNGHRNSLFLGRG